MDIQDFLAIFNGAEYPLQIGKETEARMKEAGIVAVFGAGDDLMEFRGAISDEVDAYNGTKVYLDSKGLIENKCEDHDCPYHAEAIKNAKRTIKALWNPNGRLSWAYETDILHEAFTVIEDGEPYCIGIVFKMADILK